MRSVQEHLTTVLTAVGPVTPIDASLADSAGCILAEDLTTTAVLPAHPLAECDGYALRAEDTYTPGVPGPVLLPVVHDASASDAQPLRLVQRTAVRVSSGAPLPLGADVVVPLEETDRGAAHVSIRERVVPGGHVPRRPGLRRAQRAAREPRGPARPGRPAVDRRRPERGRGQYGSRRARSAGQRPLRPDRDVARIPAGLRHHRRRGARLRPPRAPGGRPGLVRGLRAARAPVDGRLRGALPLLRPRSSEARLDLAGRDT